jgi:hypothetical protein
VKIETKFAFVGDRLPYAWLLNEMQINSALPQKKNSHPRGSRARREHQAYLQI